MAQLVRLLSKYILLILFFCGCKTTTAPKINYKSINALKGNFNSINGIVYLDNELFTGKIYTLYPNTLDTAQISGYLGGTEHGIWEKFYPKHQLQEIRAYSNGKKVGEYIAYWENGKKKLDYRFSNNEYEGTCREWNISGVLIKEMNYVKGYEDGSQKMFYDSGEARSNYVIKNGRRFGLLGTKNCINATDSIAIKL